MHILENDKVDLPNEKNPCVCRVGWSVDGSSYQLGEDKLSWGYGGTGKSSIESKFRDYGKPFGVGDVITCYVDLDKVPKAIFFALNGEYLGVAFRFTNELGTKALFPHITVKNSKFMVNFGQQPPKYPLTNGFSMIATLPEAQLIRPPAGPKNASEAEVVVMVGLPGSGKSTWCENYTRENSEKKFYILGTNLIIDRMKITGLTRKRNYHGRWEELIKRASGILNKLFAVAKKNPRNYILDQTNVYFTARRRKMESFKLYKRKAVVIVNKPNVLSQRIEKQQQMEGKVIPVNAIMEMKKNYTLPECGPSFDEVIYVEEKLPVARDIVQQYRKEGEGFKKEAPTTPVPGDKRHSPPTRNQPNTSSVEKRPKLEPSSSDRTPNRGPSSSSDRTPTRGPPPSGSGPGRGAPSSASSSDGRGHRSSDDSRKRDDDRHHYRSGDRRDEQVGRSPARNDVRGGGDRFSKDGQRSNSRDNRDRDGVRDRDNRFPRRSDDRSRSTGRRDDLPPSSRFDDNRRSSSGRPDSSRDPSKERFDRSAPVRSDHRDMNDSKPTFGDRPPMDRRGRQPSPVAPTARSQDMRIGEPSRDAPPAALLAAGAPKPLLRDGFDGRPPNTDRSQDPYRDAYPPARGNLALPGDQYNRSYPPPSSATEGDRRRPEYPPVPKPHVDPLARNPPPASQDPLYERRDERYPPRDEPPRRYDDRAAPLRDDYRSQDSYFNQKPPPRQQPPRPEDETYRRGYDALYSEERGEAYREARPNFQPRDLRDPLPPPPAQAAHKRDEFAVRREDFATRRDDHPLRRDEFPRRDDQLPPRHDDFPPPRRDDFQQPPRREDFPPPPARRGVDQPLFSRNEDEFPHRGGEFPPRRDEFPGRPRDEFPGRPREEFPGRPREEFPGRPREEFPGRPREEFPLRPREEFPPHPRDGAPPTRRNEYEGESLAERPPYGDRYDNRQQQSSGPDRRPPYYQRDEDYQRKPAESQRPRDAYNDDSRRDFHDPRAVKEEGSYNRGGGSEDLYGRDYPLQGGDYRGGAQDGSDRYNNPPPSRYPPQQDNRDNRNYRKDDSYSGPESGNPQQRDHNNQQNQDNPATDDYNRMNRERGSYQTQMTTSTANYGHTTTSTESFYRGTEPSISGPPQHRQRDRGIPPPNNQQGDPSRYRGGAENEGADGGLSNNTDRMASHPPPPEVPSASNGSSQSYEKQQEDYQKAYSQWYANYAQAFAALSQQDKK